MHRAHVASPFPIGSTPVEAANISQALLATFDLSKPDVRQKYRNTQDFLDEHRKEHAAFWARRRSFF